MAGAAQYYAYLCAVAGSAQPAAAPVVARTAASAPPKAPPKKRAHKAAEKKEEKEQPAAPVAQAPACQFFQPPLSDKDGDVFDLSFVAFKIL